MRCVGYLSTAFIDAAEVSKCYPANNENYCFYTDGTELSYDNALQYCRRKNASLPVITADNVEDMLQAFRVNDSYSVIQNLPVWTKGISNNQSAF